MKFKITDWQKHNRVLDYNAPCSKDKGFFLNGRHVPLYGTCNHQDHSGFGVSVPDSINEYRIRLLKEMVSNAYRCAHGNPSPEILDACDKYGILVMDENRNFNTSSDGLKQVRDVYKRQAYSCHFHHRKHFSHLFRVTL